MSSSGLREEYVPLHGGSLWTAREGEGPPLLLVPGGPGCCDYLGPVAEMVQDVATVVRYEPRGCGRSTPQGRFDLDECVEDVEALRAHFGWQSWSVFGHSWGANLGLLYAMRAPARVRALVYASGNGVQHDRDWHACYAASRDEEAHPEWLFEPNDEVNHLLNVAWRDYVKRPSLLREIADLALPVLCLYGEHDIRPAWPVRQLAQLVPGARFEWIEGAAHFPWTERPERVRALLRGFLAGLRAEDG